MLLLILALPLRAGVYESLEACCGEAQGGLIVRLPIHDVAPFDGLVLPCDAEDVNARIVYVKLPDSDRSIRLEFSEADYNRLHPFDRVRFNLNGCKVRKDPETGAIQVSNVMPGHILFIDDSK